MGFTQTTSAVMVFLTGLLPAGCHKTAPEKKPVPPTVVVATNAVVSAKPDGHNLGQITLTNHVETSIHLTTGEDCLFTPKVLDSQTVQISLSLESKNDYGETHNFAATQIIAQNGKPVHVAVGDVKLTFTPVISTNE